MAAEDEAKNRPVKPEESTVSEMEVVPPHRVMLHNDDVTPMDFVVEVLVSLFIPDRNKALEVMWAAHREKMALVGVMPLERAEFRVERAHERARANGYPLTFTIEPGGK